MLKKNILVFGAVFAAALTAGGLALARTQIVVQWADSGGRAGSSLLALQDVFDDHADQYGYDSDGNDIGSGTVNFYLYTDDKRVNSVVQSVIAMQKQKLLPDGMRIGVAAYKNEAHTDWDYRPVYPVDLKHFAIMYLGKQ